MVLPGTPPRLVRRYLGTFQERYLGTFQERSWDRSWDRSRDRLSRLESVLLGPFEGSFKGHFKVLSLERSKRPFLERSKVPAHRLWGGYRAAKPYSNIGTCESVSLAPP